MWSFWRFWIESIKRAFRTPLRFFSTASAVVLVLLRGYDHFWPIQDATMNVLSWAIPVAVFAATVVIGLTIGPWLLSRDTSERNTIQQQGFEDQISELRETLAPKLTIPRGSGGTVIVTDPKSSGDQIACLVVKNVSAARTVRGVEARIEASDPADLFRLEAPMQWLEAPNARSTDGLDINPGATARIQIARTDHQTGATIVRPTHLIGPGMIAGIRVYHLTVSVLASDAPKITQRVVLTVTGNSKAPLSIELDGELLLG